MWYSIGIEYGPGFNTKFSFLFFFLVVNRPKKKEKREFIVDDWSPTHVNAQSKTKDCVYVSGISTPGVLSRGYGRSDNLFSL